jgi:PAS domain S-box-containing protein
MHTQLKLSTPPEREATRLRDVARSFGALVALVSAGVLAAWVIDVPSVTQAPCWLITKPLAALGFLAGGVALVLVEANLRRLARVVVFALCCIPVGLGAVGLAMHLQGNPAMALACSPYGMSIVTALMLVGLGVGLLMLLHSTPRLLFTIHSFVLLFIALVEVMAYTFSRGPLNDAGAWLHMSLMSAILALVMVLGLRVRRPDLSYSGQVLGDGNAMLQARRLLPPMFIGPLVLGVLLDTVQRIGMLPHEITEAILVTTCGLILTGLVLWNTRGLARSERERDEAYAALAAREQDYRMLLEQAADGIFIADAGGRYVTVNTRACQMLGYTREELLSLSIPNLVVAEERGFQPLRLEELRAGKLVLSERQLRRKDGTTIWTEISARMLSDGRMQGIVRDIGERRRAEEERAFLAAIVDGSDDAIIGETLDGRIRSWNTGAQQLYGYTASEALGRPVTMLAPLERHAEIGDMLARVAGGEHVRQHETIRLRKDGELMEVSLIVSPVRDAQGRVVAASASERSLAEFKRLEAQLRQSQKMETIGQLAGGVAHDFNNILTAIMGYVELVLEELPPDAPVYDDLLQVQHAARRAAALVQQLMAFARKQVIEPYVLDLNELLDEMDKLLRRLLGADIEFVTRPASELWPVRADPAQIQQVIVNLAVNARDAMPHGGTLTIETANVLLDQEYARMHIGASSGSYVMLAVSDTGVGMSDEVQQHIFEPFFTTKEPGKGTGLGLATCYGIVKQHGGNIWVYSEVGQGTTVKVYLPAVLAPVERPHSANVSIGSVGDATVLLVEDEPAVRTIISRVLRDHGYTVLEAQNGVEALEVAEAFGGERIDALVTDVIMPRLSGTLLAAKLTARFPHIRVLYVSGYAVHAAVENGRLEAGVWFVQKPVSPAALLIKLHEVLTSEPPHE